MNSFSLKLWERIKQLSLIDKIFSTIDKHHERGVVLYKTDWSKNKIETLVQYLKRQMPSKLAQQIVDDNMHIIKGCDNDTIVDWWFKWVVIHIIYKSDEDKFGVAEKWEHIDHVIATKQADCESGATLLYVLCRLSGVPKNRLRLFGGWVLNNGRKVGHVWLQYRSSYCGRFKLMDWSYHVDLHPIADKPWAYSDKRYVDRWWGFDETRHYKGWR